MKSPATREWILILALMSALVVTSGCSGRREVSLSRVEVERRSWDSLHVKLTFTSSQPLGRNTDVTPESVAVRIFDSTYELLYDGNGTSVRIPDDRLGSREEIVIEACGEIAGVVACEQRMLRASPKRLRWRRQLTYPEYGQVARGSYDFEFRIERQLYGSDEWEPVSASSRLHAYMIASVSGWEDTKVRIPIEDGPRRFDLSRQSNYQEFDFRLARAMSRGEGVPVRFDVYVGLHQEPRLISSLERTLRQKTEAERSLDVESFVQQASELILSPYEPYERAYVYVGTWSFDESRSLYRIPLRLQWRHSSRAQERLDGVLEVAEDGTRAEFQSQRERRSFQRRRNRAYSIDRADLGPLVPVQTQTVPDEGVEALALL